jgi:uncharacterized protein YxjI
MTPQFQYPIHFKFNIGTFSNDFVAQDANGEVLFYVRQKMFKLKEDINIYSDESQSTLLYNIKADQWLDFSASYAFTDAQGQTLGKVARKGWASIWKARYELVDAASQSDIVIQEENAWVKVFDALFSEIPVLGIFTGYVFNPVYVANRTDGTLVAKIKKEPSFFGRKFSITQQAPFAKGEELRVLLGFMMMILMERSRG